MRKEKIKLIRKKINNKWIKWIIIPLLLFAFGLLTSIFISIITDITFSVLTYNSGHEVFTHWQNTEILKEQKVTGKFVGNEDNLGIIAIRFNTFNRNNTDYLIFRIKEINSKNWYYEKAYPTLVFKQDEFYPFGFPKILNSKGKTLYFELISTKGKLGDGVGVSNLSPTFGAKYQFPSKHLIKDRHQMSVFLYKKIYYFFSNSDRVYSSLIYFSPFLLYIFNLLSSLFNYRRFKLLPKRNPLIIIFLFFVLVDIFLITDRLDIVVMVLAILWITLINKYELEDKFSYTLAILLLVISAIAYLLNFPNIAEKSGAWVYVFLIIAVLRSFLGLIKNNNENI